MAGSTCVERLDISHPYPQRLQAKAINWTLTLILFTDPHSLHRHFSKGVVLDLKQGFDTSARTDGKVSPILQYLGTNLMAPAA